MPHQGASRLLLMVFPPLFVRDSNFYRVLPRGVLSIEVGKAGDRGCPGGGN